MRISAYLSEIYSTQILTNPQHCSSLAFHTVSSNVQDLSLLLSNRLPFVTVIVGAFDIDF